MSTDLKIRVGGKSPNLRALIENLRSEGAAIEGVIADDKKLFGMPGPEYTVRISTAGVLKLLEENGVMLIKSGGH